LTFGRHFVHRWVQNQGCRAGAQAISDDLELSWSHKHLDGEAGAGNLVSSCAALVCGEK